MSNDHKDMTARQISDAVQAWFDAPAHVRPAPPTDRETLAALLTLTAQAIRAALDNKVIRVDGPLGTESPTRAIIELDHIASVLLHGKGTL